MEFEGENEPAPEKKREHKEKHRTVEQKGKEKRKSPLSSPLYATSADAVALSYFHVGGSFFARL